MMLASESEVPHWEHFAHGAEPAQVSSKAKKRQRDERDRLRCLIQVCFMNISTLCAPRSTARSPTARW